MTTTEKLIHAVTEYDRKQSTKRGHNRYALAQYLARIELIALDISSGAAPREAVLAGFSGRLADACLRAIGEPITADAENMGGSWTYSPASKGGQ